MEHNLERINQIEQELIKSERDIQTLLFNITANLESEDQQFDKDLDIKETVNSLLKIQEEMHTAVEVLFKDNKRLYIQKSNLDLELSINHLSRNLQSLDKALLN